MAIFNFSSIVLRAKHCFAQYKPWNILHQHDSVTISTLSQCVYMWICMKSMKNAPCWFPTIIRHVHTNHLRQNSHPSQSISLFLLLLLRQIVWNCPEQQRLFQNAFVILKTLNTSWNAVWGQRRQIKSYATAFSPMLSLAGQSLWWRKKTVKSNS